MTVVIRTFPQLTPSNSGLLVEEILLPSDVK